MRKKQVFCLMFVFILLITSTYLENGISAKEIYSSKISNQLVKILRDEDENALIPIYIFLENYNIDEINSNLISKYGINPEIYDNPDLMYSDIISKISVDGITVGNIGKNIREVQSILNLDNTNSKYDLAIRKRINHEIYEKAHKLKKIYREETSNVNGKYISEFVKESKDYLNEIVFQPKSGGFIIAKVRNGDIKKLSELSKVENLDYFENSKVEPESWNANMVTQSDSNNGLGSNIYNNGSGYDGSEIVIGVIEAKKKRYDSTNYNLTDADLTYVDTAGVAEVVGSHATNVTAIICGKKTIIDGKTYEGVANGAKVYQTAIDTVNDTLIAIESLAEDFEVDIINFSGGSGTNNYYHGFDKAVDNLINVYKLAFVVSAGNAGFITSPGKAYNAITVGNLKTKEGYNLAVNPPYTISQISSTVEEDYLCNKPDIVAPGSGLILPTSENTLFHNTITGTSFSAPMVTGIAAKIMQSNSSAYFNINALKSYLICGADNHQITGTSVSYGALTDESGAGLVNAVKSYEIGESGNEVYGAWVSSAVTPTPYYDKAYINLNAGDRIRIALTFRKPENISIVSDYGNNIDIRLINDSLNFSAVSESTNNNVELIDVVVPADGTYTLQTKLVSSLLVWNTNPELRYWICWRVE